MHIRALLFTAALACLGTAQAAVPPDATADIEKANKDWSNAIVQGDAETIVSAYESNGVFCGVDGICYTGRQAILDMTKASLAKNGPYKSAEAHSTRLEQAHGWIYEWGEATEITAKGETKTGHYFTVWRKQPDGHWKILKNTVRH